MESTSIKKEPFEEFLFTEVSLTDQADFIGCESSTDNSCCILCPEAKFELRNLMVHFQSRKHSAQHFFETCKCENLIRHLIEHVNDVLMKSETSTIAKSDNFEANDYFEKTIDPLPRATDPDIGNSLKNSNSSDEIRLKKQSLKRKSEETYLPFAKKIRHGSHEKIKCDFCPKLFKYKQGVNKHWKLEHDPLNMFPCTKCNSRCKTLKNLHAHLRTHEPQRPKGLGELQCATCLKSFQSQKQLSLHKYTHREKFFSCDKCGSKFNNREQIKNHVLRHVGLFTKKTSHQKIICDECSMLVFSYKMKRHKIIHHSEEKPFKCDFPGCNAAFSDSRILSDHNNIHLKLKPYRCEFCPEAFRSGANLRLHRLRHTDPNRYRCEICQTNFVTKQALSKHNRRHTENPDVRPFLCEYEGCSSTFKQIEHVRIHIKRTHEKSDDVFSCEQCSKFYNRKDALGKHMRKTHNVAKRKTRVFPVESDLQKR